MIGRPACSGDGRWWASWYKVVRTPGDDQVEQVAGQGLAVGIDPWGAGDATCKDVSDHDRHGCEPGNRGHRDVGRIGPEVGGDGVHAQRLAACIPDCALGEQREDGAFEATIRTKFGGIRVRFRALVHVATDGATSVGRIHGTGVDQQGATKVRGAAEFAVRPAPGDSSLVEFTGQVEISGKLAGVISAGASRVVKRMSTEFAANLSTACAARPTV